MLFVSTHLTTLVTLRCTRTYIYLHLLCQRWDQQDGITRRPQSHGHNNTVDVATAFSNHVRCLYRHVDQAARVVEPWCQHLNLDSSTYTYKKDDNECHHCQWQNTSEDHAQKIDSIVVGMHQKQRREQGESINKIIINTNQTKQNKKHCQCKCTMKTAGV